MSTDGGRPVRWALLVLASAALLGAGGARAESSPAVSGELVCPVAAPGRVLCRVSLRSRAPRLVWADVLVTKTPGFAKPLRARIGFTHSTEHTEQSAVIPLSLVAVQAGEGPIEVEGRAVLCDVKRRGACVPHKLLLSALVRVESGEQP